MTKILNGTDICPVCGGPKLRQLKVCSSTCEMRIREKEVKHHGLQNYQEM